MQVITVTSDLNNKCFANYLKPSCDYYGLDFLVLEYRSNFFSNRLKDALLEVCLKDVSDDEIIFFTDATDATFVTNEKEILDKFYSFNSQLVFSAEMNCWPDKKLEEGYPQSNTYFKYLNSGGFIGRAGFIKEIYNKYPVFKTRYDSEYRWSNQNYWNYVFVQESADIKLDYNCEIFFNTTMSFDNIDVLRARLQSEDETELIYSVEKLRLDEQIDFFDGRIKFNITNTLPCHIHFPGPISKMLVNRDYFSEIKKQVII